MKTYADTSVLFSLYVPDANSPKADAWRRANPEPLDFTGFHRVELRNALGLAVFQQRLTPGEAQTAWQAVQADLAAGLLMAKPDLWGRLIREAESLAEHHTPAIGSRSLDILHVAAALVSGATEFCTFDVRQGKLAQLAGLHLQQISQRHLPMKAELKTIKKELWRIVFARMSIARAIRACEFISTNVRRTDDPVYYPLVTAIFVLYARPFGNNSGVGMISSKLADYDSPEKINTHAMLLRGRHGLYAHVEATGKYFDSEDNPIAPLLRLGIVLQNMNDGTVKPRTQVSEPELLLETIPQIKIVCEDLLKKLDAEEARLLKQLVEVGFKLHSGENFVDLD